MTWKLSLYFNIRQKIIIGLTACLLAIAAVGIFSFEHLREIERKLHVAELTDDFRNNILEMRRYEKNFLLYGSAEDLTENRQYIAAGMDMLDRISPEVKAQRAAAMVSRIRREMIDYGALMEEMTQRLSLDRHMGDSRLQDQVRERGKSLVASSQELVSFERERILIIVNTLRLQSLSSVAVFILMGAVLIPFVAQKIIRPLGVIENTTLRIANGDFAPLPVLETRDETQRVVEACNRMITEIEKRQDQLVQAKKLSSLGVLTSGIAHELNNPLNNISTSCQILLEELDPNAPELLRRMLTNIEGEVHRARDIVRGLLEFSREKVFSLAPIRVGTVVDRALSLIASHVPAGIDLIKDVPEGLSLELDAQRMQQVFINLIENAIHAIGAPPGQIKISAKPDPETGEAAIMVEDTGGGIPEGEVGHIFDPFFTTKAVGVGTGLGLSIVYGIIQKHHGAISVESKEGEGTRFTIRIPMTSEDGGIGLK